MKKIYTIKKAVLLLFVGFLIPFFSINSAPAAQIVFVVDESGSMGGEHTWLNGMVTSLDSALGTAGITDREYGIVGFGSSSTYGGPGASTIRAMGALPASGFTDDLVTVGGTEDGYDGINWAFNNASFGLDLSDAINVILVTDEDRDVYNSSVNYTSILNLFSENAILNAVVDGTFDSDGGGALGIDADGNAYIADGSGGYSETTGGVATSGDNNTINDYVNLAIATGGAAWDLNQLRAGGLFAQSFTEAFIDIKVQETVIIDDPSNPVPEPATMLLFGIGLLGMTGVSRRKK